MYGRSATVLKTMGACLAVVMSVACESSAPGPEADAAARDSGPTPRDTSVPDSGTPPVDGSAPDGCVADCAGACVGAPNGCGGTCPANECGGCCTTAGVCAPGSAAAACGQGGALCESCATHEICTVAESVCEALPPPVPPEDLPDFFRDQGIDFVGPFQKDGMGDDFLYVPYPTPSATETMGAFFELHTETALDRPGMHFAASLRGPDPARTIPYYGGRGIAFGDLSSFEACTGIGYFLEDFARNALSMPEMQMTYCADHPFRSATTYRVDMHVSETNTYVAIWRKVDATTYALEIETACTTEPGPWRGIGPCPQHSSDDPFGGFFVGAGFAAPADTWRVRNVYIAHW